ncbi:MAG TPA: DUF3604 domain-containing protein [Planctomycetaceae bacterium]|nr:DUF3604 domain-containing protein [Planctomycetaceae bacterium]
MHQHSAGPHRRSLQGAMSMRTYCCTRRRFVGGALATSLVTAATPRPVAPANRPDRWKLFWGDLHNHNAVGYAQGSLERSIEIAQGHLDFFAFTGHAAWHDMPAMPGDRHMKWVKGFKVHAEHWAKTQALIAQAHSDRFVALVGYEWHSSRFGDYCVVFPDEQAELYLPDHVEKLLDFVQARGAVAIPHHVAYRRGWRGANFDHFRPGASPVVEIYSEHGASERLGAPFAYLRHSMGGRWAANTIERQLQKGLRFGFIASSDDHRGYPGAHGEGIAGVWAEELSRAALFEALRARRTYAATGDRIALFVALNDRPMGSELPAVADRQIDIDAEGEDAIEVIELVRNGQVIHRHYPADQPLSSMLPGPVKCRIQYGWGPWAALDLARICQWNMTITIQGGRFVDAVPCFQSGPYAENLRDRLRIVDPHTIQVVSFTSREKCFAEDPTKSVVCHLEATPEATLTLRLEKPARQQVSVPLARLATDNLIAFTGGFTTESYVIHPLVAPAHYAVRARFVDRRSNARGADWYYVRVRQQNGQMAWSSPIWVG